VRPALWNLSSCNSKPLSAVARGGAISCCRFGVEVSWEVDCCSDFAFIIKALSGKYE
jgi:hypothetical protein